jgi:hypothetical protein
MGVRNGKLAAIALVVVALLLGVAAVLYFTRTANDLPSFFPGHAAGSTKHHVKHGIAMLGLAVVALIGAWMLSGPAEKRT